MEGSSYEIFDKAIRMVISKYRGKPFYEDLFQDCYCKILEVLKEKEYEPILNLFGYAYRIARNQTTYYLYHSKKLTTVRDDIIFESIVSDDYSVDFSSEMLELASDIINQFSNVLEIDFSEEDLLELIHKDDADIPLLRHRIIKGEFLWRISRN